MGRVKISGPARASGKQTFNQNDCAIDYATVTFPDGVTWGDIEELVIICEVWGGASMGQAVKKRGDGELLSYSPTNGWGTLSTPAESQGSIVVKTQYFSSVDSLIGTLKE